MAVIIGSARGDENGGATGGKAGDLWKLSNIIIVLNKYNKKNS